MKIIYFIIVFLIATASAGAQNDYEKEFVTMAPGAHYEAGAFYRFFLGDHWRDAWTTPIRVEVLDLDKFAGGLVPIKRGGGMQTKSLRLKGNDGHIWKFRSMDKDPEKVLPQELRETFVSDVFKDQISSANPLAAIVAAPILTEVGILQARPYLVFMPDNPKLGEFQEDFGGILGMMEIHPDVDEEEGVGFEDAEKIKSTFKLFDRLAEKKDEKLDEMEFLKARIVDGFMGDWDRHTDQWKWARYDSSDGMEYWKPIPRDRDQAFAKWDGLGPSLAEYIVPQFNNFDYEYPPVEDLTWSGRYIDRRFLTEITKHKWDSVAKFVKGKLTDEVIENAVAMLPKEHYEVVSEELISKLKSRRDKLMEYSDAYYNMINKIVDIYATERDDYVIVDRISDNETSVEIYRMRKKKGKLQVYYKVFDNNLTREFRINTLGGDDKVLVKGEADRSPRVRVVGGKGKDEFVDSSRVNGWLWGFLPIPSAETKTEFFDSGKKTKIVEGPGTYHNDTKMPEPIDFYEKYEPALRNRSVDWLISPVIGLNSSDGLRIGGGMMMYSYNFRMDPYEYWLNGTVDFATKPESFSFNLNGLFNNVILGTTVSGDFERSNLLFSRYYGYGNETIITEFDDDDDQDTLYRVDEEMTRLAGAIHLNYYGSIKNTFGVELKFSNLKVRNDSLIDAVDDIYSKNRLNQIKLFYQFTIDTRDNEFYPESGVFVNLSGAVFPKLLDNKVTYFQLKGDASYYATLRTFTDFTLAMRAGGGAVSDEHFFRESIFLGGSDNLRGFTRRRFAGDAAVFGQLELRIFLIPMKIVVPGKFGVHAFVESGRVFDKEYINSDMWHSSYGGGIWMSFINRAVLGSMTYGKSEETYQIYLSLGMGF